MNRRATRFLLVAGLAEQAQAKHFAASITAGRPNVQTANSDPHEIVGFVRDCTGAVMPSMPVHAGKIAGRTNGRGFYLLHMRRAGTYQVVATGGGGTVKSRRVHVP